MIEEWAMLVANLGFPIAAFLMMFWMANKTIKENTKAIKEMIIIMRK